MDINTLNQLIKKSGLKKKHIAKKAGITSMELSHIIRQRRTPKPNVIKKILNTLKSYET